MRAPLIVRAEHRQQRQQQQHDRREAGGVGERLQPAVVAQHDQHHDEQQHARAPSRSAGRAANVARGGLARSVARSMRWIIASPRPLSAATTGSSTGSAYGATIRTTTWQAMHQRGQPAAVRHDVGGDACPRRRGRPRRTADADDQAEDQQEQLGAAATPVREATRGPRIDVLALTASPRCSQAATGSPMERGTAERLGLADGFCRGACRRGAGPSARERPGERLGDGPENRPKKDPAMYPASAKASWHGWLSESALGRPLPGRSAA